MENRIHGKTKVCGLVGNPIEHTLSPMIHNQLAKKTGTDLVYVPFLVQSEGLYNAINGAFELNITGLNVTVPYKNQVIQYLQEVDDIARAIGAVNTLVRTKGGYMGYNTDMEGLFRGMISDGIRIKGETVIILGAGGAAKAAAYLCVREQASKVYLLNRNVERAIVLADSMNYAFKTDIVFPMLLNDYDKIPEEHCLAIQATSVGLSPNCESAVIEDKDFYKKIHTGLDIIYNPEVTKFMKLVNMSGGKSYNGLKMLLYQGIIAYEHWNQVQIDEATASWLYELISEELKNHE